MKRSALLALITAIVLALSAMPVNAQVPLTWVSGVGDDANPCSRFAPCATFAGAMPKTTAGGEIDCLDPADFGTVNATFKPLTITKSITIDCGQIPGGGGFVSLGSNAITVSGSGIVVTLRGLDLEGGGTGLIGINVTQAATVYVKSSVIYGFQGGAATGISFSGGGTLIVEDTVVHGNGTGIALSGSGGNVTMTLHDVIVHSNSGNGVSLTTSGSSARATIDHSTLAFNGGTGLIVNGSAATALIGSSTVTGNGTGVAAPLGAMYSFKNNQIAGNTVDGTPIAAIPALTDTHDFNADGISDILWRNNTTPSSTVAMWLMNGDTISSSGSVATVTNTFAILGQRDFDGNGTADLLWRDTSGNLYMWFMNGATMSSSATLGNVSPTTWTVMGTADMNGDGKGDILWQDTAGDLAIWLMNGSTISSTVTLGTVPPSSNWSIVGTTTGSILWKNTTSSPYSYAVWNVNGSTVTSSTLGSVPTNWVVQGVGDFNADGVPDILWRDTTSGTVAIWFLNSSGQVLSSGTVGAVSTGTTWAINETGDFDGNGMSDILWVDGSGNIAIWFMNGATIASSISLGNIGTTWTVQAQHAE